VGNDKPVAHPTWLEVGRDKSIGYRCATGLVYNADRSAWKREESVPNLVTLDRDNYRFDNFLKVVKSAPNLVILNRGKKNKELSPEQPKSHIKEPKLVRESITVGCTQPPRLIEQSATTKHTRTAIILTCTF